MDKSAQETHDKNRQQTPVIQIKGLRKSFGSIEVLKGIDLIAHPGEVIALIGGSGSGKSTTLRCTNALEIPSSAEKFMLLGETVSFIKQHNGEIRVKDPAHLRFLRTRLAMVFQNFNLWPHMTLEENVMEAPIHVLGKPKLEARKKAHELLERVGLIDKREAYPAYLSGGQQQRGAIARALAVDPEVMLFDEPTSALDPELVGEVLAVIKGLADEGRTMVIVTHEMQFAADVADTVMFLSEGRVEEMGPPDQIFRSPKSERLKQFIKTVN